MKAKLKKLGADKPTATSTASIPNEESAEEKALDKQEAEITANEAKTEKNMDKMEKTYESQTAAKKALDDEMKEVKAAATKGLEANAKAGSVDALGETVEVDDEMD